MDGKRKSALHVEENTKKKRSQNVSIRSSLCNEDMKMRIRDSWVQVCANKNEDFEMIKEPFKCCVINNIIDEQLFFDDLLDELSSLDMKAKSNDLYQFRQSEDLANFDSPAIDNLKYFLHQQCHSWLQDITGIQLGDKLAVTYSSYSDSNYLLCHDDKCEDRRIAFILYLNREWKEEYGGSLQLFKTNHSGQPVDVVQSIIPEFNKFVFFEVCDKSFHQVAEVLTPDKSRITINGWFHSSVLSKHSIFTETLETRISSHPPSDLETLLEYINPVYLEPSYHNEVSELFEEESQISLSRFLKEDVYDRLCTALRNNDIQWIKQGPSNRRRYFVPLEETLPSCMKLFIDFFSSSAVFRFLHKLTKLDLQPSTREQEKNKVGEVSNSDDIATREPKCSFEIQMWEKGCYTLANDDDPTFKQSALDAVIYFNVDEVDEEHGGFTSYIARDEDLELLTVTPTKNALALSYRDDETLRFVKYINHHFNGKFYTMSFVYYE